ncbi:MAG: hypothetical protein Q8M76_02980, partial [Spirochaetaceae bacterium]|nr:hypothetical protein [Spirochaetaceae bacterium]
MNVVQCPGTPLVTEMKVVPVAGRDSMLLNLCGAHGPYFTRNLVILRDGSGNIGLGEVPGGEGIRKTLERSVPLVVGRSIGEANGILDSVRKKLLGGAAGPRSTVHEVTSEAEAAVLMQPHEIN